MSRPAFDRMELTEGMRSDGPCDASSGGCAHHRIIGLGFGHHIGFFFRSSSANDQGNVTAWSACIQCQSHQSSAMLHPQIGMPTPPESVCEIQKSQAKRTAHIDSAHSLFINELRPLEA